METKIEKLKDYGIYIKSHCEAVDYEDMIQAPSIERASELLHERLPTVVRGEWDPIDLMPYIHEHEELT